MLQLVNKTLVKYINKEVIIIILILLTLVSLIMIIYNYNVFSKITGGNPYLETKIFYKPLDIINMSQAYGDLGRNVYIKNSLALDIFIPIFLSAFLLCTYIYIAKDNCDFKNIKKVATFSMLYSLSDLLENFSMIYILKSFPNVKMSLAIIARCLTSFKYIFVIVVIIFIIGELRKSIYNKFYAK